MSAPGGVLERFRRPEYTGENRCLPCTVVNAVIAGALALAAVGVGWTVSPAAGIVAGVAVAGLSAASIYLRGYLVPGTPTLTKRYFPEWLLRLFGKAETAPEPVTEADLDPERELMRANALEERPDGSDLRLTDEFREAWYGAIDRVEGADRERLLELLDVEGNVEYEEFGSAFTATVDGHTVGKWESRAAFHADLGAANVLAQRYPDWDALSIEVQSQLLNGLRLFIDACPSCGGEPEFGTDTVASCCSEYEVAAVACRDCEARLFESRPM
jgi:hypothetical protein